MAVLNNAIWLTGSGGHAVSGSTVISEAGNSTTVTGTFSANAWDESQNGYAVSEFGAFGVSDPITADFEFSNPVENLQFDLQHVTAGGSTYDDMFTLRLFDDTGTLIPAATVMAGISGVTDQSVYVNADGSVTVEADGSGTTPVTIAVPGPVSALKIAYDNGPDGTITGGAGIGDLSFTIPPEVVCFARGTMIATAKGLVAVENLKLGDRIPTRDNGIKPIRWIGSKTVAATGKLAPVVFSAGILGNDCDLLLSPRHRVLLTGWKAELLFGEPEVLCPAQHLINGDTIYTAPAPEIEYFHIMFDAHEIILANGAPCESFQINSANMTALDQDTRREILTLFPELSAECGGLPTARRVLKQFETEMLLTQ